MNNSIFYYYLLLICCIILDLSFKKFINLCKLRKPNVKIFVLKNASLILEKHGLYCTDCECMHLIARLNYATNIFYNTFILS